MSLFEIYIVCSFFDIWKYIIRFIAFTLYLLHSCLRRNFFGDALLNKDYTHLFDFVIFRSFAISQVISTKNTHLINYLICKTSIICIISKHNIANRNFLLLRFIENYKELSVLWDMSSNID